MNERFKTLWFEAAESKNGNSWEEQTEFMKKFAELIVRECCDVLYDNELGGYQTNYVLKEHFGIEN